MLHDYVYYLRVKGELIDDLIFGSEAAAKESAECAGYEDDEVIEFDCE